jgi:hypothetical protein
VFNRPTRCHNGDVARDLLLRSTSLMSPGWRVRWRRYARRAQRPAQSLVFLLPFVLVYEIGARWGTDARHAPEDLLAYGVIENLLGWFGLVGSWLPPLVLVAALVIWHRQRRQRWRVYWSALPLMLAESVALALPLLALSTLFEAPPRARWLDALGAGLYEELVFRLLLISGLAWLLVKVLRLSRVQAIGLAVGLATLAFALCHFEPLGSEWLAWKPFGFRVVCGIYLSVLFLERGLGICCGCHAAYNLLLVWLHQ